MLAARAPSLPEALERAAEQGLPYRSWMARSSLPTAARTRRPARRERRSISGTPARRTGPPGTCRRWPRRAASRNRVSDVVPGSTHDLTAARELVLPEARPYLKDLPILADSRYEGAGAGVLVPVKKPARGELDPDTKPQRAAALPALPGRTRLRADVPAVARPAADYGQPEHDRRHHEIRARPRAIRTQDDQLKVTEKTSVVHHDRPCTACHLPRDAMSPGNGTEQPTPDQNALPLKASSPEVWTLIPGPRRSRQRTFQQPSRRVNRRFNHAIQRPQSPRSATA